MVKNFDYMFSHFDTIPACDRRTDGHLATAKSRFAYHCTVIIVTEHVLVITHKVTASRDISLEIQMQAACMGGTVGMDSTAVAVPPLSEIQHEVRQNIVLSTCSIYHVLVEILKDVCFRTHEMASKCTKIAIVCDCAPDPAERAYDTPPDPQLAEDGIPEPTSRVLAVHLFSCLWHSRRHFDHLFCRTNVISVARR